MKLLKFIFLLSFISNTLFADSKFCIQVTNANNFNPNHMKPAVSRILNNFEKARIDKRGGKLVLRVGNYNRYSYALKDLKDIQKMYSDAYIRRCDYRVSSVIYSKNITKTTQQRKLKSPIIHKKVKQYTDIPPSPKIRKRVNRRRLVIVNGEVQILDESNKRDTKLRKTLKIKKVPRYNEASLFESNNQHKKVQKHFIYNKNNKYSNDFYKECKKCYATVSTETEVKTVQTQKQKREINYTQEIKHDIKIDTVEDKSWFKDVFQKDTQQPKIKKDKIKYTYIEESKSPYKKTKKDIYYNQKIIQKREIIDNTPEPEEIYIAEIKQKDEDEEDDTAFIEIEADDEMDMGIEEDIFSDTSEYAPRKNQEPVYEKPKYKKRKVEKEKESGFFDFLATPKKEEDVEDDIDIDVDVNVDDIEDYSLEELEPDVAPIKTTKKSGFFDFLKKPVKEQKTQKQFIQRDEPPKKIEPKIVKQESYYDDYEPIGNYLDTPSSVKKDIKQLPSSPQIKEKKYDLMDEYESDEYIKEPIKKVKKITNEYKDEYQNQYMFQNSEEQRPDTQQAYFSQAVMDEIKTEKTTEELYKNQYMFENSQEKILQKDEPQEKMKRYVEIIKEPQRVEEPIKQYVEIVKEPMKKIEQASDIEDDISYKNQYMYQHQNTPTEKDNQYFNDDKEDENPYKNQYMFQNSNDDGGMEQPFFVKEKKDDSSNYQYQHSNHKREEPEIDDDY